MRGRAPDGAYAQSNPILIEAMLGDDGAPPCVAATTGRDDTRARRASVGGDAARRDAEGGTVSEQPPSPRICKRGHRVSAEDGTGVVKRQTRSRRLYLTCVACRRDYHRDLTNLGLKRGTWGQQ